MRTITGILCLLALTLPLNLFAGAREIDSAVQDAARKTVSAMESARLNEEGTLAILPFDNDQHGIYRVFRSAFNQYAREFQVYSRDQADELILETEVKYGDLRGDMMDPNTIKEFAHKGVDMLLHASIREVRDTRAETLVRLNVNVFSSTTAEIIWSANIEGQYEESLLSRAFPNGTIPREVDYAIEDAAYETIKSMTNSDLAGRRIAFLPFPGDFPSNGVSPVFRAELGRIPGQFDFYTRQTEEWNKLLSEIEWSDRRSDVMDPMTIKMFGNIKGVDALLYGSIREIGFANNEAVARFTLTLADVETGSILWTSNIAGSWKPAPPLPNNEALTVVMQELAQVFLEDLNASLPFNANYKVYPLPLSGDTVGFQSILMPELTRARGQGISFYSGIPGQRGQRVASKMASELSVGGTNDLVSLARISQQLGQLVEERYDSGSGRGSQAAPDVRDAVLFGTMREPVIRNNYAQLTVTMQIADLETGQILWGTTITEKTKQTELQKLQGDIDEVEGFVTNNMNLVVIIGIVIGALIAIFLLMKFMSLFFRAR